MATDPVNAASDFSRRTNAISVGVLLIFLYALCVVLVVVGFSAYVFRTDWNTSLEANGSTVRNVDTLSFLIAQERSIEERIEAQQQDIDAIETRIREAILEREDEKVAEDQAKTVLADTTQLGRAFLVEASNSLVGADKAEILDLLEFEGLPLVSRVSAGLAKFESVSFLAISAGSAMPSKGIDEKEEASELLAQLNAHRAEVQTTYLRFNGAAERVNLLTQQRDQSLEIQNNHREALAALRDEHLPINSEHRARWHALEDSSWWNPMPKLVNSPTILLTLIATIAAGALGTLVSYSRTTFLQGENPRASNLLITIGEGISAAIGVFLFAGAGMLVLSQGGGANGRLELSPFTVAFLAFVSGFMAESAFLRIASFGKDLFSPKSEPVGQSGPPPPGPPG